MGASPPSSPQGGGSLRSFALTRRRRRRHCQALPVATEPATETGIITPLHRWKGASGRPPLSLPTEKHWPEIEDSKE